MAVLSAFFSIIPLGATRFAGEKRAARQTPFHGTVD